MNSIFPILAVETTGEMCSVAIHLDQKNFIELNYLEKHIHSQKLINMVDNVLTQSDIKLENLKAIAVSMGPGSFTGLRIGLAAVKGLAFGSGLGIIPVPTFESYALQITEALPRNNVFNLITNASIDDVYLAKYKFGSGSVETISPLELIDKSELRNKLNINETNYGNAIVNEVEILNIQLRASNVARWAYLFGSELLTFDYDNLEPNYIKEFIGKVKK
jgi:tRNA threonylcarbamoyladenosine biosynthesis protein TsaB